MTLPLPIPTIEDAIKALEARLQSTVERLAAGGLFAEFQAGEISKLSADLSALREMRAAAAKQ